MLQTMTKNWWLLVLRGVVAIIFGVLALILPGAALLSLVLLFGIYALVDGVASLVHAFRRHEHDNMWLLILEGVVGIGAGVVAFLRPGLAGFALLILIAVWAILTGILEIVAAIRLRQEIKNEWLMALAGVASIGFGVLILFFPTAGAFTVALLVASYAIAFGVLMIVLGFRLRNADVPPGDSAADADEGLPAAA